MRGGQIRGAMARGVAGLLGGLLAWSLGAQPTLAWQGKLIGGPGYTAWRSSVAGQAGRRSGWGRGISGMGAYQFGEHLRLTSGLLQGELELEDHTVVSRTLIFGGVRGVLPLLTDLYLCAGVEAGASRLKVAEALNVDAQGRTHMVFSESWTLAVQPVAAVGFRPRPKYHLELMVASPVDRHGQGWQGSWLVMLGIFFWMGAGTPPPG